MTGEQRKRVDAAYDLAGDRERARGDDHPLLHSARSLHYCLRCGHREDAFGHCLDMLAKFFELGGFPAVADREARDDDTLIVRAGYLVAALERIEEDTEPAVSLGMTRLLAITNALYRGELRGRCHLRDGLIALAKGAEDLLDAPST